MNKNNGQKALNQLLDAAIGAAMLKDYGNHAYFGEAMANKRNRNRYLRTNRLGKFRRGHKH